MRDWLEFLLTMALNLALGALLVLAAIGLDTLITR